MALERFPDRGEYEEITLSDDDYDASKSNITISCLTQSAKNEDLWGPFRNYSLKRVSDLKKYSSNFMKKDMSF